MIFCRPAALELHITRVQRRGAQGGHGIPDAKICERWTTSQRSFQHRVRVQPDGNRSRRHSDLGCS